LDEEDVPVLTMYGIVFMKKDILAQIESSKIIAERLSFGKAAGARLLVTGAFAKGTCSHSFKKILCDGLFLAT
jgi:hypothetical protein